jgi:hypothetical protein
MGLPFQILEKLIETEDLRTTIGNRAKQTFYEKFDEKRILPQLIALLHYK